MGGRGRNRLVSKGGEGRRDITLHMDVVGGKGRRGDRDRVGGRSDRMSDSRWAGYG